MRMYHKYKLQSYFGQNHASLQDVVAIQFVDKNMRQGFCLTWGRVFNQHELFKVIALQCLQQNFTTVVSMRFCYSLQEAAHCQNFYEQWIYFVQQNIPYYTNYKNWIKKKRCMIAHSLDVKFLKI